MSTFVKHNLDEDIVIPENFDDITDLYIPLEAPLQGVCYPKALTIKNVPNLDKVAFTLLKLAASQPQREFSIVLIHDGLRYIFRGHSIDSVDGKVYIFRRLPDEIPDIKDTGLHQSIVNVLLSESLNKGGLIIIAGETGQGKSTTAAATIAYRLRNFGSFCLTIEDPIELPLNGIYPNALDPNSEENRGVCFQTALDGNEEALYDMLKSSLRCYPAKSNSILFLGETRDSKMAAEVLKIAANGHLVITTMHGSDIISSIARFISMASAEMSEKEARNLFAMVFKLLIHQRLERRTKDNSVLKAKILYGGGVNANSIQTKIRDDTLHLLATEVEMQNAKLGRGLPLN